MQEEYDNDKIIKKCKEIMEIIHIVKKEEDNDNEGSMTDYRYYKIFEIILDIVEERIEYLKDKKCKKK